MTFISKFIIFNKKSGRDIGYDFGWLGMIIIGLSFVLLTTMFTIIYIKDLNRRLFIVHTTAQSKFEKLTAYNNMLLLEQGYWGAQSRIQAVAQQQLQMCVPPSIDILTIKM